jgi:hypothetical protein
METNIDTRTPLTSAYTERDRLQTALTAHLAEARATKERYEGLIAAQNRIIAQAGAGLDPVKIALGRTVVNVRGNIASARYGSGHLRHDSQGGIRQLVVQDAIKWLATGDGAGLQAGYLGVKNYDGFGDQRTDCEYGMGPRHGSIVFAVEGREGLRKHGWAFMDDEQREAAIYYLTNLQAVQEAEARAA